VALSIAWARNLVSNPLLEKDLRSTARSLKFFLSVIGFLFVACIILLAAAADLRLERSGTSRILFTVIFYTQAASIGLAIPAYSCTSIAGERQRRTFDLLRITSLKPWEILWGKFIAIQVFILVFVAAFLPLVAICFLYGGIDPEWLVTLYLYLLLSAAACSAFCLMLSAALSNTIKSTVVGYMFMLIFGVPWIGLAVDVYDLEDSRRAVQAAGLLSEESLTIGMALALTLTFFYLAGASLLKPPSWNKSTSLRIWFVAFIASMNFFFATKVPKGIDEELFLAFLFCGIGIPTALAAVGFCGEQASLPERLRKKTEKLPTLLRIFAPGRRSAAVLVRLVSLLAAFAGLIVLLRRGRNIDYPEVWWGLAAYFVFINFCCTLAAAARNMWDSPRSRMITISVLAALVMLPMLVLLDLNRHHPLAGILWISPPMALSDFLDLEFGGIASGPAFFFGFYITATAGVFALGQIIRRRRLVEVDKPRTTQAPVEGEVLQHS